jgi:pimeloyl-ACP methyl ester carboxylesterase
MRARTGSRSITALALACLVGAPAPLAAQTVGDAAEIRMTEALLLPKVGTGGRRPVRPDAVAAMIVEGTWSAPRSGGIVEALDGSEQAWFEAKASDKGWIADRALRGGYAYWKVDSAQERVAILEARGQSLTYVNGVPRTGDPYNTGWHRLPVRLEAGSNDLLFRVGRGRVRASLSEPVSPAFFNTRDLTLPDIFPERRGKPLGAVVVVNTSDEPLDSASIIASTNTAGGPVVTINRIPSVPAMSTRKVPFRFEVSPPPGSAEMAVELQLHAHDDGGTSVLDTTTVKVRVREMGQHHKRTFRSAIDDTCQYYAVAPSTGSGTDDAPALVLSLHGAGVEAIGQAACYAPRDWAVVIAPTNRRPFGFDWEDWGRLDAMEVLERTTRNFGADPARTYVTGHSMGGHGTWHLGVTYPDRFAAVGPSAGWISFWSYTGAADADETDMDRMLRRAANASDTAALQRNLLHHGVYVLHGDADDNVPVEQARTMRRSLAEFHGDFVYYERPGAGHWWGNQCVDWPPMLDFFERHVRPAPGEVRTLEFHTASPGISATCDWVTVQAQERPLEVSSVTFAFDPKEQHLTGTTDNVAVLAIDGNALDLAPSAALELDDQPFENIVPDGPDRTIHLRRVNETWMRARGAPQASAKGPHRYGPFKDAFRHRPVLVYGTHGSEAENAWAFAKARLDAETFWYRGNGAFDVVADDAFDAGDYADRSVILFGNAGTNGAWEALLGGGAVDVRAGRVMLGSRPIDGDDLGVLLVRPRRDSDHAYVAVVGGTGLAGMRVTIFSSSARTPCEPATRAYARPGSSEWTGRWSRASSCMWSEGSGVRDQGSGVVRGCAAGIHVIRTAAAQPPPTLTPDP